MTLAQITYPLTILHKPDGASYQKWGGPEGVRAAAAAGATAIDVDGQEDAAGEFEALHWAGPGEHGFDAPGHAELLHRRAETMTRAQLALFVSTAKDSKGYRIHTVREVMEVAAPLGITVCLEVKSMGDFAKLRRDAEETGCRLIVMTLPHLGGKNVGYKRLAAAKKVGLPTMVLLNDTRFAAGKVPTDAWQHVDYVKGGQAAWRAGKPARVIFLGGGSKYGITVSPSNAREVTARLRKKWPHQHAPAPAPKPPVATVPRRMQPSAYFLGANGSHVTWLGERLVAHGYGRFYTEGPGPNFTDSDRKAVQAFQVAQGWTGSDADGFPGTETLRRLAAAPGAKPAPPPVTQPPVVTPRPPTAPPASSVQHLIAIAKKYVGFREGANNDNPFAGRMGFSNHQAWCASFVCAVFKEAGLLALITTPSPGVDQLAAGFKREKRWSEYPALGAVVCYGRPSDLNHTGLVIAYDAKTITTIEGNTNNDGGREGTGVFLKTRLRASSNVIGYGYPRFPEGITSADPAWARRAPATATPSVPTAPAPTPPVVLPPAAFQPRIDGIDISHWQGGAMDFAKAKAAGVRFVYHKATEHTAMKDQLYARRRKEVAAAGIPFGAYHFARPGRSSGAAQAKFFLKVAAPGHALGAKAGDLRPCLDLEDRGGLNAAQLQRWVEDFVDVIRQGTGKPPVLYTNFDLIRDPGCYLWRARYNNDNRQPLPIDAWVRWSIWQFSNGVLGRPSTVPGIGKCDINTLFPGFDLSRIILPKAA